MVELDLKAIADAMNKSCGTDIDLSKVEGKKLTGSDDGEIHIVEPKEGGRK